MFLWNIFQAKRKKRIWTFTFETLRYLIDLFKGHIDFYQDSQYKK